MMDPLSIAAIWLVPKNDSSFYELRSEDPNQHLKDFLKLVNSLDLDGIAIRRRDRFSTHVLLKLAEAVYSNSSLERTRMNTKQSPFTFRERIGPIPQPQALRTTFEARVRDYMVAHTERMERFENAIFKQREEINDKMAEMFGLLKELTTSRAPEKVLIREEAKSLA
ncbi:hypothetical protein Tco_0047400 [Tanacetum coccineum]